MPALLPVPAVLDLDQVRADLGRLDRCVSARQLYICASQAKALLAEVDKLNTILAEVDTVKAAA